ncbi:MAG: OsmC-related (seleno)protein [Solirubrobacteraceae bacterium]
MDEIVRKVQPSADRPGPAVRPDSTHPIAVRLTGEIVENERKRILVAEDVPKGSSFEIFSDEGEGIGGEERAPTPLSYLAAAVAFCLLTQVSQFGKVRQLDLDGVRIEQTMRFSIQGSWLRGDRRGAGLDLETDLHVTSGEPPERIRDCVRAAERACFVVQSLHPDIASRTRVTLNGRPLDVD